jgi:phosphatidylinositol alpha 1,6-mannosyltransferase
MLTRRGDHLPMRICLATDTFIPEINGVTTVLATMRRQLIERGHEVLVLAPRYGGEEPESGVVRLGSIPCPGYAQVHLSWPWCRGLSHTLDQFQPHVVQAVTEGPMGWFARSYALRRKLPLATSFHTDFPRYAREYLGMWAVRPTQWWLRRFHSRAAFTMTPSGNTRRELASLGVPAPVVWGRGVDTTWFHPNRRSPLRRQERGGDDRVHILHVGRLAVEKDVDTLVGAFQLAEAELGAKAVFVVAGDGPKASVVRAALPFARHYGFVNRGEVADLYADADLFVFPSPTETCGLVVLEALASRVPVIGANAGGVPENILDGVTGTLTAPRSATAFAEAIVRFAQNESMRYPMSEAARAFAIGRDWSHEIDRLEVLFQSIAQTPSAVPAPISWPTSASVG